MVIHSYPWYPSDWLQCESRFDLSLQERGLYRDLLDLCYRDGSLPSDECKLQLMAACTESDFRSSWTKVKHLFHEQDGRLYNVKVTEVRDRIIEWHDAKQKAGKRGGSAKAQLKHSHSSATSKTVAEPKPSTTTSTTTSTLYTEADIPDFIARLTAEWPDNRKVSENLIVDALTECLTGKPEAEWSIWLDRIMQNAKVYLASDEVQRGVCSRVDRWLREKNPLADHGKSPNSGPDPRMIL